MKEFFDKHKKGIKEMLTYIILIVVVLLIKVYIVTPVRVNGESMMGTLHSKDIMLLNEITYKFNDIKRFDIVVVKIKNENIIKRVIGLPGEKIEYKDNKLYVNGKYVKEDFDHAKTEDFNIEEIESTVVPEGSYFVLGDNRVNSVDSRILGFIPEGQILGRAKYTIYPFNRFGKKN